ncbi:hypothetical protein DPV78_001053 [Talaromyces pinophilus]|nr:hypothetical protein DPV78_001053 [Talaromyces pinophilus]
MLLRYTELGSRRTKMMEYVGTQLSWSQSEARQVGDHRDAKTAAEARQRRRKVQNRKNQRAP